MGFPRKHWVAGFWMALAGAAMGGVHYAPKNIAWGEVSVSDVERVEVAPAGLAAFSAGAPEVREKRTLTLPSGNRLRITERIETDAREKRRASS